MTSASSSSVPIRRAAVCRSLGLGLGLGFVAVAANAAQVDLTVTGAAGQPLIDAVALIEPVSGKAAVRPMPDVEIGQAKRRFTSRVSLVTVGTKVNFPNFDTVRHHVYSFSAAKTFELKLYAGVPNVPVLFDKPGVAVLGCNIHDSMATWIVVADTPWFARSDATGRARIADVPPGAYRLRWWHPALPPGSEPAASSITVGAAGLQQAMRLNVNEPP